jgi:hypothetical protein
MDVWIHVFLTLVLVGGEWSVSRPDRQIPRERGPSTHWIGGKVGRNPAWPTKTENLSTLSDELRLLGCPISSQSLPNNFPWIQNLNMQKIVAVLFL